MKLKVKEGLDIPIRGKPDARVETLPQPKKISLNLTPFVDLRLKALVKAGDEVTIGQPLVENKNVPGQVFVSPAAGKVLEVERGTKRQLTNIIIERAENEGEYQHETLKQSSAADVVQFLMKTGLMPYIRMRPFDLVANPRYLPRDIFVSALETLPFLPPAELQVKGYEEDFRKGLELLKTITSGKVYLVTQANATSEAYNSPFVEHVKIEGPHPAANASVHIHKIAPIRSVRDIVWTLNTVGVIVLGRMARTGKLHTRRVIALGGEGFLPNARCFYETREGVSIRELTEGRLVGNDVRLISGDPLTGSRVSLDDFLQFGDRAVTAIPENHEREFMHMMRAGGEKYSAFKIYLSGIKSAPSEGYSFSTNQHGEHRAFVDDAIYQKVMPMRIPAIPLVKAIASEDFELAEQLGLLEVAPEDFALPTFIDPSKNEMIDIVRNGLKRYAAEVLE